MGYKVLITMDLHSATDLQRDSFYLFLANNKWNKLSGLTTTWTASFKNEVSRLSAIRTLKQEILDAKSNSRVKGVNYAFQMDQKEIIIDSI